MTDVLTAGVEVGAFDPVVAAADAGAEFAEEHRQLAPGVVAAAKSSGLFCMALPERFGGLGLSPARIVEVLERVSYANGSAGWCGMIGNATAFFGWLDEVVAESLLHDAPRVAAASVFGPNGTAHPDGAGGYTIDGRWTFASGCLHSEWVQLGVMVMTADGPGVRTDGGADWRFAYLPIGDVEIVDTWDTLGLRGTGSNDIVVRAASVPAERLAMPMLDPPRASDSIFQLGFWGLLPIFMTPFQLGVARRALDELAATLVAGLSKPGRPPAGADPQVHHTLGKATAALLSARALLDDAVGAASDAVDAGRPLASADHDRLALVMHHAVATAVDVVDAAYHLAGPAAVRRSSTIQRCFRDIHAARLHIGFDLDGFRAPARRALGL